MDYFNGSSESDILRHINHNVSIGVPFENSVLTQTSEEIVFYDTPGSNNASVDQKAHKQALTELMAGQTNALPILVTTRDSIMAEDVAEIKKMLDDYSDNFACTNCLIVCSKCDELVSNQLEQKIKPQIKDWHGGTSILFSTPIGAIGERKQNKSEWLDDDYRKLYKRWKKNMADAEEKIILPSYNIIACEDSHASATIDENSDLYATGIPSIEIEILHYIENYANYRKCVRGKQALQQSMNSVREALKVQSNEAENAIEEAAREKEKKRQELVNELKHICVDDIKKQGDQIEKDYSEIVSTYLAGISDTMSKLYDDLNEKGSFEMDKEFNDALKKNCQEELINKNYYGENGIQKQIIRSLDKMANEFIEKLKAFVSNNEASLSADGRSILKQYIEKEIQPPKYSEVQSVIDDMSEFFEKVALVPHAITKKIFKDDNKAKNDWIESKKKTFEKSLLTKKTFLGKPDYGIFRVTTISTPMKKYDKEIREWSENYKDYILKQLDVSNNILSGLIKAISDFNLSQDIFDICAQEYNFYLIGKIENYDEVAELADVYSEEIALLIRMRNDDSLVNTVRREKYRNIIGAEAIVSMLAVPDEEDASIIKQERKKFLSGKYPNDVEVVLSTDISGEMAPIVAMNVTNVKNPYPDLSKKPDIGIYFNRIRFVDQYLNWFKLNHDKNNDMLKSTGDRMSIAQKRYLMDIVSCFDSYKKQYKYVADYGKALSKRLLVNVTSTIEKPYTHRFFYVLGLAAFLVNIETDDEELKSKIKSAERFLSSSISFAPKMTRRDILMAATYVYLVGKEK